MAKKKAKKVVSRKVVKKAKPKKGIRYLSIPSSGLNALELRVASLEIEVAKLHQTDIKIKAQFGL